ncbi:SDR family oxidoreductase [Hyphomonas sp.]|uniref:SDR family NAD(P)-dependent oxidoreductase n=1 Tax=Hyphomonas sp. TaxID=87 RepID=UPI0032EDF6CB
MNVAGKTALITGGASGIGAALSSELSARGAQVIVADIDDAGAETVARTAGNGAVAMAVDVASIDSINTLADRIRFEIGGLDLIFANAGVSAASPLLDAAQDAFDWQFAVNVRGPWALAKAFLPEMIEARRPGHFIITASEHALGLQHTGVGIYTSTKHATLGLAEVLRAEMPATIQVSIFCPGLVTTRLHDAARFGVVPDAPGDLKAIGEAISEKGMAAGTVAKMAIDGVERGDFFIVTHPTAFAAAQRRFAELEQAFSAQAPMTEDARKYDMNTIIASVLSQMGTTS